MKMSVGDVLLHPWHMDADILNEVGNIPGLQTGLSPNCSLQAAYNIVYTSPLPPYTTLSFRRVSVPYTREGNCRLIQLGRIGRSTVAGWLRQQTEYGSSNTRDEEQRAGRLCSTSNHVSLEFPSNSSYICATGYKMQVLECQKFQTNMTN